MKDDFQENLPFREDSDEEGLFDAQLALPFSALPWAAPVREITKRDGRSEIFDKRKIALAILRAAPPESHLEPETAESIAAAVAIYLSKQMNGKPATADHVSDAVERVLIQMSQADVALAYARYRDRRARIRRLQKGDMQGILTEIEEARHGRGAALAKDLALHVQTSQDRLVTWDGNRIVEALQLETGMGAPLASIIAAEVEKQIKSAGITVLTASLIRELVGARLIEHGLTEENERRRRLGVPLYDASRIIRGQAVDVPGSTPGETDNILARAVKKEYALAEVFSTRVTQAHLLGQIHLSDLEFVDRLCSCDQYASLSLADGPSAGFLFETCEERPGPLETAGRMMRQYDFLQTFFSGTVGWRSFNHLAAPFFRHAGDGEMQAFARAFINECAYRAGGPSCHPVKVSLAWSAPEEFPLPEGTHSWKELEPVARRLFFAVLEVYRGGDTRGDTYAAPELEVVLEPALFQTFEGSSGLMQAARAALERGAVCFRRKTGPASASRQISGKTALLTETVWHRVVLNLPRAAVSTSNEQAFRAEIERLCEIAVAAHREKRDFIESMLHPSGYAPLAALSRAFSADEDLNSESGIFQVAVDGLFECAEIVLGAGQASFQERVRFMADVLEHMKRLLQALSAREGIQCALSANTDSRVSRRFAAVDSGLYPRLLEGIIKTQVETQALTYCPGTALPENYNLSPFEIARVAGTLHKHLTGSPFARIPIPLKTASENTLVDLLNKVFYQTECKGVAFYRGSV